MRDWPNDHHGQPLMLLEVDVPYLTMEDHRVLFYLRGAFQR